jgi:membrane peptidoglycan carboxypeptidase
MATSVWVGYPNALVEMRNVHGIEVAGGTFPAQIWHDYMTAAHTDCTSFPQPKNPPDFSTFFGDHSASGRDLGGAGGGYSPPSGADNSAGGQDYKGYDPRLYASPPQGPPPATPPPSGGVHPGGGAGGGPGPGAGSGGGGGAGNPP